MDNYFFDNTESLLRVIISAPILYGSVILFIRLSGKRSASQLNNFDWIVTVAMGGLVASGIILKDVYIFEALVGIAFLLLLQYGATKAIFHSETIDQLIKASPTLLVYDGEFQKEAMERERITEKEICTAIREKGLAGLRDVKAAILETDATVSVLAKSGDATKEPSICRGIEGWPSSES